MIRFRLLPLLVLAAGLGARSSLADLTLNFGVNSIVGKTSTGGNLLGFNIRIGKFQTITPTLGNYGSWSTDFLDLPGITAGLLIADTGAFVAPPVSEFGPLAANGDGSEIYSSTPSGFTTNDLINVWIYNTAQTQAILLSSSTWALPLISGSPDARTFGWIIGQGTPAVGALSVVGGVGQVANNSYTDGASEPGVRLVTSAVPEPSSLVLAVAGILGLVCRRRPRSA